MQRLEAELAVYSAIQSAQLFSLWLFCGLLVTNLVLIVWVGFPHPLCLLLLALNVAWVRFEWTGLRVADESVRRVRRNGARFLLSSDWVVYETDPAVHGRHRPGHVPACPASVR